MLMKQRITERQLFTLNDCNNNETYRILIFNEDVNKLSIQKDIDQIKYKFYEQDYDGWIIEDVLTELAKKYDFDVLQYCGKLEM